MSRSLMLSGPPSLTDLVLLPHRILVRIFLSGRVANSRRVQPVHFLIHLVASARSELFSSVDLLYTTHISMGVQKNLVWTASGGAMCMFHLPVMLGNGPQFIIPIKNYYPAFSLRIPGFSAKM